MALGIHGGAGTLGVIILTYSILRRYWWRALFYVVFIVIEAFAITDHIDEARQD